MVDPESRRRLATTDGLIMAALCGLLFCVYLLTASLTLVSDDELFILDTTESLARRGSVRLSETADLSWPGESQVEPVMPILAAPIYWLANTFDGIGNTHATLLFNALVTAVTAGLVYLYLRELDYGPPAGLTSGLAFGLATIVWPYTKTFFREPLHMATLFATAYALLRFRGAAVHRDRRAIGWLALTAGLGLVSLFAKESALYALPLLLLILAPQAAGLWRSQLDWRRAGPVVLIALGLGLLAFWLFRQNFVGSRFDIELRLFQMRRNLDEAWAGISGFIFSPGKSLFLFSPPLALGLAAPWLGVRARRWDASWPLILTAVSIFVYALVRGSFWWGGTNWGPRYMLPMTPFLIVSAAPAVQAALDSRRLLVKAALAALLVAGAAVQAGGVALRLGDYYNWIGSVRPDGAWTIGLWDPYYSAALSHWRLALSGTYAIDFAWLRALPGGPAWMFPVVTLPLIAAMASAMWYGLARAAAAPLKRRVMLGMALTGFVLTGLVTWLSLHAVYYDQRYHGGNDNLHQLVAAVQAASADAPDPVIFLNNRTYFLFMLNYYKGPLEWYTLALNPNELLQSGRTRPAPSTDPYELISRKATGKRIYDVVDCFGRKHPGYVEICSLREHATAFLMMEFGPFTPEALRPLEWWFSRNFYYRGVREFGPTTRLVEFSTSTLSPPLAELAVHPANYRLGDSIVLTGWDVDPDAGRLRPGTVLNISTRWQATAAPGADYKIGTYLISPEGAVVAQDDSIPVNGFWPTSTWGAGEVVRHNVALGLPKDLPPGFYEVWTLMYSPADSARLPVQDSTGTTILDHISLFTIEVTR